MIVYQLHNLLHILFSISITSIQKMKSHEQASANGIFIDEAITIDNLKNRPIKHAFSRESFNSRPSKDIPLFPQVQQLMNTAKANQAFERANWEQALKNTEAKMNRFYKNEEVSLWVELDHFKMYGPGIYLYFNFMKSLTVAFLLMSIIELIPIIYNFFSCNGLTNLTVSANYYLASTSIAAYDSSSDNHSRQNKFLNTIPDLVVSIIFLIFYFYWLHKSEVLTEQVRTQVKLKSYNVLELANPSSKATCDDILSYFSQFGSVKQVAPVKNYDQSLRLSKQIYDYEVEIKQLQFLNFGQPNSDIQQKIKKRQQSINQIYKELVLYEDDTKEEEVIKYFVTFDLIEQKQKALKELQPYIKATCDCYTSTIPENYLLMGQKVQIKACHTQPDEIIWQNQHVTWKSRWMRALIQYILLLIIIASGFLFISLLNTLAPSSSTLVSTSSYTQTSILLQTNSTIIQSWCISNAKTVLTSSGSTIYNFCWSYIQQYQIKISMTVGIAVAIIIIKAIIRAVVVFLAKFQRYKSHTEQSKDIVQNLFLTYLCTTVLITFLLQAQISGVSFKNYISYFISSSYLTDNLNSLNQYSDFVTSWYIDIGYQIFLTWVVLIIHPNLTMPFFLYFRQKWIHWKAKDQDVQANMQKRLQPADFQIEDNYANTLMIVFVSLALSGGMPAITIAAFFAILSRFIYFKYIFIRYCKIPKAIDEALDNKVTSILQYALLIHFIISIWMFGVSSIFNYDSFSFSTYITNLNYSFLTQIGFILDRIFATWYYSAVFFVVLFIFIFKAIFYNLIAQRFMQNPKSTTIIPEQMHSANEGEADKKFLSVSNRGLCDSYKIENNPDYNFVLPIMHKKRKFIIKVKDLAQNM